MNDAAARVRAVVGLALRCATPGDALHGELRARLVDGSGLSGQGVDLALARHLETRISDAELDSLLGSVTTAERCHVVLSAHVCTAALRAIALAVATSRDVFVKASRRDPHLAELLVREGRRVGLALTSVDAVTAQPGDEVQVYGGSRAIEAVRSRLPRGVIVRAHGPGFGLALIDGRDPEGDAEHLVDDVVPFDQRGCLSPRIALVERDPSAFARELGRAFGRREAVIPLGTPSIEERAARAMFLETGRAIGEVHAGTAHAVVFDPEPEAPMLPPPGRCILVLDAAKAGILESLATSVSATGRSKDAAEPAFLASQPIRRLPLGWMQRPPLDGAVDQRTKVMRT